MLLASDAPTAARPDALQRAAAMAMPTPEQEVWRYSRIGELNLANVVPVITRTVISGIESAGGSDLELTVHDVFDELNEAYHHPVVVRVPRGRTLAEPVVVTHHIEGAQAAHVPRLVIEVGDDAQVTVIERFVGGDAGSVVIPRLLIDVAQAGRLQYVAINQLDRSSWLLGHQQAVGARDSSLQLATVALGGDYARVRTDVRAAGQGATARQVAVYFADGTQMHDFRTLQDHVAPRTTSDLLFKGAVRDQAKSVYTGLIRIGEHAKGAAAFQTNRNLTLSSGAWAESVPNLDIRTNDVKCSHASTVGPIDEEQRFYLESRGVRPELAERLVVLGFFDEVLDQLPIGSLADELRSEIARKLSGAAA